MSAVDSIKHAYQFIRSLSLYNFYRKNSKAYIGFVTLVALVGYGYLLMFPLGVVFGSYQLYLTILTPFDNHMLLATVSWASVVLFCAGITHGIATIKLKQPEGIALAKENAQLVFDRIEEIEESIKWPKIDNVILSRRFELNIIKTPRWYAPFWSKSTLVIGYPFLQTLSPENFDCALTRKILQYSKRKNLLVNWLSFLRVSWAQYPAAFKERNIVGDQLSYWFFHFYSWAYRSLALYTTQLDELQADELALNHLNDRDLFRAIESVRLVQKFLNEHYWPKLSDALARASTSPEKIKPYEHLPKTAAQMMKSNKVDQWLKILTLEDESEGSHEPSFRERMDMMGYTKMCPLKPFEKTAAEYYFGPANPKLITHMNKLWAYHIKQELDKNKQSESARKSNPAEQKLLVAF
jgi:hypothetical protein